MTNSFSTALIRIFSGPVVAAVIAAPLAAATTEGEFATRGVGAETCASLLTTFSDQEGSVVSDQLVAWLSGYLSATSRLTPDVFDSLPVHDIFGVATLVLRVCEQNEASLVETAAATIVQGFTDVAPKTSSPIQSVGDETNSVEIRTVVIKSVQEALVDLEYLPANASDGVFGPNTRQAIVAYQTSLTLEPTGLPDPITVFALLFNLP